MTNLIKKQFKECGQLFSHSKYIEVEEQLKLRKRRKLIFKKYFSEDDNYCLVTRDVKGGHIVFVPSEDDNSIYFYHLLFDSLIFRILLGHYDNEKKIGNVTIRTLRDLPILNVSNDIIQAGAILDLSIKTIMDIMRDEDDIVLLESVRSLFQELRDAFVLELYVKPFFEINNINIVNPFVEVVEGLKGQTLATVVPELLKVVIDSNGVLISNLKRLRVLMGNIYETLKANE